MKTSARSISLILSLVLITAGCAKKAALGSTVPTTDSAAVSSSSTANSNGTSVTIVAASSAQCANGGTVLEIFRDLNSNGILDPSETVVTSTPICNGTQGMGAGIQVVAAPSASCPAGGSVMTTFADANNNGVLDSGETITSVSTICSGTNGTNGSNGTNAVISEANATSAQCSSGGIVYTSQTDGQAAQSTIVCNGNNGNNGTNGTNGTNGSNGSNAVFETGSIGPAVSGQSFTACHHDYVYIPNSANDSRGWLVLRHQANGSADQGIGATGFDVWNVDIADFYLASEVGGVNYCQLHWDPISKILTYNVVDNTYSQAGMSGTIQL